MNVSVGAVSGVQGKVLFRGRADCDRDAPARFASQRLKHSDRIALEATTNNWPIVEILRPFVAAIVVGNPLKTKAIAEAKIKTDKVDAEVLAQLMRCNYLPDVWQTGQNLSVDEPNALMRARMGLWEPWAGNCPGPPGHISCFRKRVSRRCLERRMLNCCRTGDDLIVAMVPGTLRRNC